MTEKPRAGEPEDMARRRTSPRRAGADDVRKRPAGAPEAPTGPAGAPDAELDERQDDERQVEEDLEQLLADTQRERDEYLELAQRTRADFENYRKRVARDAEDATKRGRAELAGELVPVLDNLERALAAAALDPAAALAGELGPEGSLEQGVVLTYRELHATLVRAGVEAYDPAGERFDPSWHEALSTRAAKDAEPGTVVEVLQKGYRLDGRVIRAARVVVSE